MFFALILSIQPLPDSLDPDIGYFYKIADVNRGLSGCVRSFSPSLAAHAFFFIFLCKYDRYPAPLILTRNPNPLR